jgi:hypothetical protein
MLCLWTMAEAMAQTHLRIESSLLALGCPFHLHVGVCVSSWQLQQIKRVLTSYKLPRQWWSL